MLSSFSREPLNNIKSCAIARVCSKFLLQHIARSVLRKMRRMPCFSSYTVLIILRECWSN